MHASKARVSAHTLQEEMMQPFAVADVKRRIVIVKYDFPSAQKADIGGLSDHLGASRGLLGSLDYPIAGGTKANGVQPGKEHEQH